jgi:polar amino acid transport system substrate-binding protein
MLQQTKRRPLWLLSLFSLAVLSIFVAACGGETPGPSTTIKVSVTPPATIKAGVLTIGSDLSYAPQEFVDPATNETVGFDIDIIKDIAARMGLKTEIVNSSFSTLIESLGSKRFDVAISALTINEERSAKADFLPYFKAGESILVQKGNPKNIKVIADTCGLDVGVQLGTVEKDEADAASQECEKAGKPPIKITALDQQTDVIQLLATNRVVATYQDSPVTDYYLKQNSGRFEVAGSVIGIADEGIAVRKGDTATLTAITAAFQAMKAEGKYKEYLDKWGVTAGEYKGFNSGAAQAVADRPYRLI